MTAKFLEQHHVAVQYEQFKLTYTVPEKHARYTPDFILPNGIVVETKGRFVTADRQKHKLIQAQYPQLDVRFVFSNANSRISKTSKTTYAKWCDTSGIPYAHRSLPEEWLTEDTPEETKQAARDALGWEPAKD